MKLSIRDSYGTTSLVDVEPTSTIASLIDMHYTNRVDLHDQMSLAVYQQSSQLYWNDAPLEENKTVADYAFDEFSIICLVSLSGPASSLGEAAEMELPPIPDELYCAISMQVLLDPVTLPCGKVVEREVIEKWLDLRTTSPFTRRPLCRSDLKPDHSIKKDVADFFARYQNTPFYEGLKSKQYQPQPRVVPSNEPREAARHRVYEYDDITFRHSLEPREEVRRRVFEDLSEAELLAMVRSHLSSVGAPLESRPSQMIMGPRPLQVPMLERPIVSSFSFFPSHSRGLHGMDDAAAWRILSKKELLTFGIKIDYSMC